MNFIGIDLHKNSSQVCILTEDGELSSRNPRSSGVTSGRLSSFYALDGIAATNFLTAERSALRWVFEAGGKVRTIRLTFSFTIIPDEAPAHELSPVFSFPYTVKARSKRTRVLDVVTPQEKSSVDGITSSAAGCVAKIAFRRGMPCVGSRPCGDIEEALT